MNTKQRVLLLATLAAFLAAATFGQANDNVQRAVSAVSQLQGRLLNPASFQLRGVWVNKPDKHGQSAICFAYGGQNRMGGYSVSMAILRQSGSLDDLGPQNPQDTLGLQYLVCRQGIRIADIGADVVAALNPTPAAAQPVTLKSPADRQKIVDGFNTGFLQQKIAAYVEITGNTLTIHSERANSIRFHQFVLSVNKELLDTFKLVEITTIIYTNDADQKYTFDVTTGQEVKPQ